MSSKKTKTPKEPRPNKYAIKVGIKGEFDEVFTVIKKHKELKNKKA